MVILIVLCFGVEFLWCLHDFIFIVKRSPGN